ncbi:MAG: DMT family transporter [Pseudomonadota bacterium]
MPGVPSVRQRLSPRQRHGLALVYLLIMGVSWGLQLVLLKIAALDGLNEFGILTISLLLLAPIYGVVLLARRQAYVPTWRHVWFFLVAGTLGYIVPLVAVVYAASHLPAGLLALIASLTPVVAIVFAASLGMERATRVRIIAVVLGLTAAVIVLLGDLALPDAGAWIWVPIAFVVPLAYGLDAIYVSARWPAELSSLQVVTGEALVSGLVLLPPYLFSGSWISFGGVWTDGHWAILAFVAVSLVEAFLFFHLVRTSGAVLVSFGNLVSLVAGIFWGVLIFGERLPVSAWIAGALLSVALVCVAFGAQDQSDTAEAKAG